MKRSLASILFVLSIIPWSLAQSGLKLPDENPDLAKEKYVLLTDNYESGDYDQAYAALLWIIDKAPDIHESAYVTGLKTIKKMIGKDPSSADLKQKLMDVYDLRIRYFGNEANVLSRKAFDAYIYFRDIPEHVNDISDIFDRLYEIGKSGIATNLLYPYFDVKALQKEKGDINDQKVIEAYQNITEIVQALPESEDLEKIQKLIDTRLVQVLKTDCKSLDKLVISSSENDSLSLRQAKLIIKLSLAFGCNDEPIFFQSLKVLHQHEPTLKLAKLISAIHLGKGEHQEALVYLNKALELAQNGKEKSSVYYEMAKVYYVFGDKVNARKMAYNSLKHDPENLAGYTLIGDLYFTSFDECKKNKSRVEDRSLFYAAYEKYALAKDREKMSMAEQQFPTMEEIHTESFKEDSIINTGCWIGEPVKIRRRPELASN